MISALLAVLFVAAVVLDAAVMAFPWLGGAGVVVWLLVWVVLAAHACAAAVTPVAGIRRRLDAVLPLIAALFVFPSVAWHLDDPRVLHHETTQEIGCALRTLASSPSRGYTDTCLFGYPTRQHLLPALPSLALGRTQTALHLGSAAYLLLALLIFAPDWRLASRSGATARFSPPWEWCCSRTSTFSTTSCSPSSRASTRCSSR